MKISTDFFQYTSNSHCKVMVYFINYGYAGIDSYGHYTKVNDDDIDSKKSVTHL